MFFRIYFLVRILDRFNNPPPLCEFSFVFRPTPKFNLELNNWEQKIRSSRYSFRGSSIALEDKYIVVVFLFNWKDYLLGYISREILINLGSWSTVHSDFALFHWKCIPCRKCMFQILLNRLKLYWGVLSSKMEQFWSFWTNIGHERFRSINFPSN